MNKLLLFVLMLLVHALPAQDAQKIFQQTKAAFGNWNDVQAIRMHFIGHTHWLEQSENPDEHFITGYDDVTEVRSVKDQKLFQDTESKIFQNKVPTRSALVINNGAGSMKYGTRYYPMPYSYFQQQELWHSYGPEQLLKKASNQTLKYEGSIKLGGVDHHQISFTENNLTTKLFINKNTFLISEAHIDTFLPYEFFFSVWGKFTTKIQYSLYALNQGNILYPMQWDVYRIDRPWKKITINDIEFLKTTPDSLFTNTDTKIAEPTKTVQDVPLALDKTIQVADGIFMIPGNWNTGWVEQQDGIVVIEAPISSGFSGQLVAELKKKYPSKKIKAAVVTSDAWPHLGGIREYFAEGIPVYSSALNKEILDRVAQSDYSLLPDKFQTKKIKPQLRLVESPVEITGSSAEIKKSENPFVIYPVAGEGGERMSVIYFPKQKVLYASDLIQRSAPGEFFFPEYLLEVENVVKRHSLDVQTVYAMHTDPFPWKEVVETLQKIENP